MNRLAVIAFAVLAALTVFNRYRSKINENRLISEHQKVQEYLKGDAKSWKDKYGNANAEREKLEVSRVNAEIALKKKIDSLKVEINGRPTSYTEITKVIRDTVYAESGSTRIYPDRVEFPFDYKGEFLNVYDGLAYASLVDSTVNGVNFKFDYTVKLAIIESRKKKFLREDDYLIRVVSKDPNSTITGLSKIDIKKYKKKLGIGVNASFINVNKDGVNFYPNVGLGIHYRF